MVRRKSEDIVIKTDNPQEKPSKPKFVHVEIVDKGKMYIEDLHPKLLDEEKKETEEVSRLGKVSKKRGK